MVDSSKHFDRTLTSRYECKYLLNERVAAAIRAYLQPHVQLDPFSKLRADRRYRVMSLYLDSPGLRLYRDTAQGVRNRYKIRLRYYHESGSGPVFFEVKKRSNFIVRKNRERMTSRQGDSFLLHGSCAISEQNSSNLVEFLDRCREASAKPALRLRYWREAYESRGVDPVRITFDTSVEHSLIHAPGLLERTARWQATKFDGAVILEVKFTDLRPHWLDRMLRRFELDKVSVAKYAESIAQVLRVGDKKELQATVAKRPLTGLPLRSRIQVFE